MQKNMDYYVWHRRQCAEIKEDVDQDFLPPIALCQQRRVQAIDCPCNVETNSNPYAYDKNDQLDGNSSTISNQKSDQAEKTNKTDNLDKAAKSRHKERQRSSDINEAFKTLQNVIPHIPDGLRLPKVKTLRLAINYIDYLNDLLNNVSDGYPMQKRRRLPNDDEEDQTGGRKRIKLTNFAHIVQAEIQTRNSYTERASEIVHTNKTSDNESSCVLPYGYVLQEHLNKERSTVQQFNLSWILRND